MQFVLGGLALLLAGCWAAVQQSGAKDAEAAKRTVDEANKDLPPWVKGSEKDGPVVGASDCYVEREIPMEHGATAEWFKAQMRRFAKADAINKACSGPDDNNASAHIVGSDPQEYVGLCMSGNEVGNKMYLGYKPGDIRCSSGVETFTLRKIQ